MTVNNNEEIDSHEEDVPADGVVQDKNNTGDFWSADFDPLDKDNIFNYTLYMTAHDNVKLYTKIPSINAAQTEN